MTSNTVLPNPDEIFQQWLDKANDKLLLKRYKNYASKSLSVSASETVKSVETTAFVLMQVEERPAEMRSFEAKESASVKDLDRKTFWEFSGSIEKDQWRGKPFVLMWKSLKPGSCPDCGGKGYGACDCSQGFVPCRECHGEQYVKCPNCQGKGSFVNQIEVKKGESGKSRKEELTFNCSVCFGEGKIVCPTCSGLSKLPHSCRGTGKVECKNCKGTGQVADLLEEPVPIKRTVQERWITGYSGDVHDRISSVLGEIRHKIPKFEAKDETQLDNKHIEPFFPSVSKDVEKIVKNTKKKVLDLEKRNTESYYPPLIVYPGIKLSCQTNKGHNFEIVAIGDVNNYKIVDAGW